jgi:glycine cleavage system H protein
MSQLPAELKYTRSHEWARLNDDGTVTIGITDHAQEQLGDLVFVEIPKLNSTVAAGETCAVVESVKAASDIYAPLAGEVIEANAALTESPELINKDPFGDGWMFKLQPDNATALEDLMDAEAYQSHIETAD